MSSMHCSVVMNPFEIVSVNKASAKIAMDPSIFLIIVLPEHRNRI